MNNVSIRNLSVTSNSYIIGDTSMNNVSIRNLSVTSNSYIIGDTSMNNVSIRNLSVTGQSFIIGDTSMNNVSIRNLSVTGQSFIIGDTSMNNVSIRNLSVTGNASFVGDTSMNNVSIRTLFVRQNASFLGDTSMNNLSVNKLTINNLSIENTTFSGTTIFGTLASTPTTIFSTNYNGYFNGIYNTSGVLELGSTTFQRQRLTYNGTTGNMSMIWHTSPTDYTREAGRFEVVGRNTGTALDRINGDLSIEFTTTTIKNSVNVDSLTVNNNTININTGSGPTGYLNVPNVFQIGKGNKLIQMYFTPGASTDGYSSMLFCSYSGELRQAGRFETWDYGNGTSLTRGDFKIIFNSTTIPNNVNIGTEQSFTNSTTNTVDIGALNNTTVNIKGSTISIGSGTNYTGTLNLLTDGTSITNTINMGSNGTNINIATNTLFDKTVKIATESTNTNTVTIGTLNKTTLSIRGSTISIASGTNYSGTLNLLTDGTNVANTINMGCNGTDINIATSTSYDRTIKIATESTLANTINIGGATTSINICDYAGFNKTINIATKATNQNGNYVNIGTYALTYLLLKGVTLNIDVGNGISINSNINGITMKAPLLLEQATVPKFYPNTDGVGKFGSEYPIGSLRFATIYGNGGTPDYYNWPNDQFISDYSVPGGSFTSETNKLLTITPPDLGFWNIEINILLNAAQTWTLTLALEGGWNNFAIQTSTTATQRFHANTITGWYGGTPIAKKNNKCNLYVKSQSLLSISNIHIRILRII
jgi:hypothetical protein